MNKTHYQLFAFALLVGTPGVISLLSNAIPALRYTVQPSPEEAAARPDYETPVPDPQEGLPQELKPPLPPSQQQDGPQSGTAFSAAPALDPNGMSVSGSDPTGMAVAPAAGDPSASAPAVDQGGNGPTEEDLIRARS